jgi:hypothetical protein
VASDAGDGAALGVFGAGRRCSVMLGSSPRCPSGRMLIQHGTCKTKQIARRCSIPGLESLSQDIVLVLATWLALEPGWD